MPLRFPNRRRETVRWTVVLESTLLSMALAALLAPPGFGLTAVTEPATEPEASGETTAVPGSPAQA